MNWIASCGTRARCT